MTSTEQKIDLAKLLAGIVKVPAAINCTVTGICIDSRKIKPGDLFLAYPGETVDGRDFIAAAIEQGAVAVVCADVLPKKLLNNKQVPIVIVPQLRAKVGIIAAKFYGSPSQQLTVIGVTGTNGKTSTAYFIATALTSLGLPCGFIGTIGVGFPEQLNPVINTTPDPITLQQWLLKFVQQGAKAVAMEVSSHSLIQDRVQGINFTIAVFTNLTRDHLDYHGNMENYGAAKKLLFQQSGVTYAAVNADDNFGQELIRELGAPLQVYAYTTQDQVVAAVPTLKAEKITLSLTGIAAQINTPWGNGNLHSHLLGRFNISNLLAVITVLGIMRLKMPLVLTKVSELETINGRMQKFGGGKKPLVVVDYAHTPDALEQTLLALREHCHGALWCVFGCGGGRDRGKRPMMGQIAERHSDHIVITNDNPRSENPEAIVTDILAGLLCPWAAEVEYDRTAAIAHAITCAQSGDIVLVAGKGHEEYQIIGKEKLPFRDQEVVTKILQAKI